MEDVIMTFEEVKTKVDNYFDKVSAEELLEKLTEKYGMREYDFNDIDAIPDEHLVGNAEIA